MGILEVNSAFVSCPEPWESQYQVGSVRDVDPEWGACEANGRPSGGFFGFSHRGGLAFVILPLAVSAIKSLKREATEALDWGFVSLCFETAFLKLSSLADFISDLSSQNFSFSCPTLFPSGLRTNKGKGDWKWAGSWRTLLGTKGPPCHPLFLFVEKDFDLLDFQGYPKSGLIREVGSEGMQKLRKSRQETIVHRILVPP